MSRVAKVYCAQRKICHQLPRAVYMPWLGIRMVSRHVVIRDFMNGGLAGRKVPDGISATIPDSVPRECIASN